MEAFVNPFAVKPTDYKGPLELDLLDLQTDTKVKNLYALHQCDAPKFWASVSDTDVDNKYPTLIENCLKFIAMFGSTYVCEQTFSLMKLNKSPLRSNMSDCNLANILRVATATDLTPRFEKIVHRTSS